jgi:hypothetical protein
MIGRSSARSLALILSFSALIIGQPGCSTKEDTENKPSERYSCEGTMAQCLRIKTGWSFEGQISNEVFIDPSVVKLADGRFRIYGNADTPAGSPRKVISFISADGFTYTREGGTRLTGDSGHDAFGPTVVVLPDGRFRMYLTDQRQYIGTYGAPAFISAISTDGLHFNWEPGERLRYLGSGDETSGIRGTNVLLLPDGTYRMYYVGGPVLGSRTGKVLSAVSVDGLTWIRENGVRHDPKTLCPPSEGAPNPKMFLDQSGVYHMFTAAAACDDMNHTNEAIGIFEGTSPDGLTFTFSKTAVVQGYYIKSLYHGNSTDPFENPEDPMVIPTPAGFRMYFNCGNSSATPPDARYQSVITGTIH